MYMRQIMQLSVALAMLMPSAVHASESISGDYVAKDSVRVEVAATNELRTITGTVYEPWHVRFVGYELAQYLYENNLCLEEYYQ